MYIYIYSVAMITLAVSPTTNPNYLKLLSKKKRIYTDDD